RAEDVIGAWRRRLKPYGRVAAWDHLALDAEVRHREAVEHVLGDHGQLDGHAGRYMQRIDFMLSAGMLRLPHPLLADDVDVHGIGRRVVDAEVEQRAPHKADQEDAERDDGP